jgi:hypothetical protein
MPLPFIIPTEVFMACGPPKVMKNGFCSAIFSTWKRPPPPCHPDRSTA